MTVASVGVPAPVAPMYEHVVAALAAGASVITPTRRLAAAVRRSFDAHQQHAGRTAWVSPDVLPWSAWAQRLWASVQVNLPEPLLLVLSPQQELALWARVISESQVASPLLHLENVAEAAREAWATAHAWRLWPLLRRHPLSEEGRAFLGWSEAFEHFCTREAMLDPPRMSERLIALLREGVPHRPERLSLYGFDALDPQRTELLDALRASGAKVEVISPGGMRTAGGALLPQPGTPQELRAAAQWARTRLAVRPEASIGVVVPDLERLRGEVARVFDEVLVPQTLLAPWHEHARPWNLSLGVPLSHWPLVHTALLLLELATERLSAHAAGVLLRSAFLGAAQREQGARALLDARLRRLGEPYATLRTLEYLAADEGRAHACPLLLERLRLLASHARAARSPVLLPSAWGPILQGLLAAAGWPGERTLDSTEYQTLEAWRELVAGLAQLDVVYGPLSYASMLERVRRLASERVFQPESRPAPIQVLGLLESEGLEFDHLLVLGLHAGAWPRPARPNPLLPAALQRSAGTPRGCADWELAFARRMTAGWQRAAPEVVFSYPVATDDHTLEPSPLIASLSAATPVPVGVDYRVELHMAQRHELPEDTPGVSLPPGITFAGGARLIQDQAACPFRAFALYRLGASALEEPHEGLDARERGRLLHSAVAQLWAALRSSRRCAALDETALTEEVQRAVDQALVRWRNRRGSVFKDRFLAVERDRLETLLKEWLAVEAPRAPFEVLAVEEPSTLEVGGVLLDLRLDRVDRLEGGGELLLDYKTGEAQVVRWFEARPDEPQLPLYALARKTAPAGLAFARVARGECAFVGLAERDDVAPGIAAFAPAKGRADDWASQLQSWRQSLATLAAQFRSGFAPVAPKRYPNTCDRCHLRMLCRVEDLMGSTAEPEGVSEKES